MSKMSLSLKIKNESDVCSCNKTFVFQIKIKYGSKEYIIKI